MRTRTRGVVQLGRQPRRAEHALQMQRHVVGREMRAERLDEAAAAHGGERGAVGRRGVAIGEGHSFSRMMMSSSAWLPTMKS